MDIENIEIIRTEALYFVFRDKVLFSSHLNPAIDLITSNSRAIYAVERPDFRKSLSVDSQKL
ncbi:MAG: hypothetical protein D3909_10390 [Candidatus Electrothrix sp. ATG1]|nr:hypothetical protein [Candidatus Electrothrix sp. ATG1]